MTCHFDSLIVMLLSSSPLCCLASADQRITGESHVVKHVRMPCCKQIQIQPPERRLGFYFFFIFFFLCAALSLQKQARCLNSFNVLCSSGFTATLVVTAATVYICARSPSTVNTGIPSILCPWVTIYYSSGPLLWHSWLIINHRRWAHMPAHMCYVWAPHRLYSSSSSAPNIHWLNNELGLLHRPLWPNECEKLAVKELGGGRDKALTLGSDSRVKQTVFYLQTMRTCSIFLDLNGPKQKVNRWSFCGDRRLNNGIQRRYFLKAPDSCSL